MAPAYESTVPSLVPPALEDAAQPRLQHSRSCTAVLRCCLLRGCTWDHTSTHTRTPLRRPVICSPAPLAGSELDSGRMPPPAPDGCRVMPCRLRTQRSAGGSSWASGPRCAAPRSAAGYGGACTVLAWPPAAVAALVRWRCRRWPSGGRPAGCSLCRLLDRGT